MFSKIVTSQQTFLEPLQNQEHQQKQQDENIGSIATFCNSITTIKIRYQLVIRVLVWYWHSPCEMIDILFGNMLNLIVMLEPQIL